MTSRAKRVGVFALVGTLLQLLILWVVGTSFEVNVAQTGKVQDYLPADKIWFSPEGSLNTSLQLGTCVVVSQWRMQSSLSEWSDSTTVVDATNGTILWAGSYPEASSALAACRERCGDQCRESPPPPWAVDPSGTRLVVVRPDHRLRVCDLPRARCGGAGSDGDSLDLDLGQTDVVDLALTSTGVVVVLSGDMKVELWSLHQRSKGLAGTPLQSDRTWRFFDSTGKLVLAGSNDPPTHLALNAMVVPDPDHMDQWSRKYGVLTDVGLADIVEPGCFAAADPGSGSVTPVCLNELWTEEPAVNRFTEGVEVGTFAVPPGTQEFVFHQKDRIIAGGAFPGLYLSKLAEPLQKIASPEEETVSLAIRDDLLAVQNPGKLIVLRLGQRPRVNGTGQVIVYTIPLFWSVLALWLGMLQDRSQ